MIFLVYCIVSLFYVFYPPPLHLESRKPLCHLQSIDVTSRWREDWQSATVVNSTLVVDPTIRLPGFDLHRRQWSLLNRFRTGQGHCNACNKKWGFIDNELCDCGEIQTMSHIVNFCPLTEFDGGLLRLHEADEAAVDWLTTWLLAHDNNNNNNWCSIAISAQTCYIEP